VRAVVQRVSQASVVVGPAGRILMHKALGMKLTIATMGANRGDSYDAEPGVRCAMSDPPDAIRGTNRFGECVSRTYEVHEKYHPSDRKSLPFADPLHEWQEPALKRQMQHVPRWDAGQGSRTQRWPFSCSVARISAQDLGHDVRVLLSTYGDAVTNRWWDWRCGCGRWARRCGCARRLTGRSGRPTRRREGNERRGRAQHEVRQSWRRR
jgi:hypothetical protein